MSRGPELGFFVSMSTISSRRLSGRFMHAISVHKVLVRHDSDVLLVQSMGGSVDFTSKPGETVFCLSVNLGIPNANEIAAFLHKSKTRRKFSITLKNESSESGARLLLRPIFPPSTLSLSTHVSQFFYCLFQRSKLSHQILVALPPFP